MKELKKQYSDLEALEYEEPTKEAVLKNIKAGLEEVKLLKKGKLKTTSAKDFLIKL